MHLSRSNIVMSFVQKDLAVALAALGLYWVLLFVLPVYSPKGSYLTLSMSSLMGGVSLGVLAGGVSKGVNTGWPEK